MIQDVHEAGRVEEQAWGERQSCANCGEHLVYQSWSQTAPRKFWPVGQYVKCQDYPHSVAFTKTDEEVSCVSV